jgi:hypothetical protein
MVAKPLITAMTSSLAPVLSLEPASRPRKALARAEAGFGMLRGPSTCGHREDDGI